MIGGLRCEFGGCLLCLVFENGVETELMRVKRLYAKGEI